MKATKVAFEFEPVKGSTLIRKVIFNILTKDISVWVGFMGTTYTLEENDKFDPTESEAVKMLKFHEYRNLEDTKQT